MTPPEEDTVNGPWRRAATALLCTAALAAVAALAGCGAGGVAAPVRGGRLGAGWHVYPGAFASTDAYRSGPVSLAAQPAGCFIAVGMDNTGYGGAAATWSADGDCTHPILVGGKHTGDEQKPELDRSGQLLDVAVGADGWMVAAGRLQFANDFGGYNGEFLRGGGGTGGWLSVATVDDPTNDTGDDQTRRGHLGPAAITALPGGGYVAVGRHDAVPAAWTSPTGVDWTEVPMPLAAGQTSAAATDVTTGPGGTLVALGSITTDPDFATANGSPAAWYSTDGGHHWQQATLPAGTGGQLTAVVGWSGGFTAVGGSGLAGGTPVVMNSPDGRTWTADPAPAKAGAQWLRAAVALPDGTILASAGTGRSAGRTPDTECATAWRRAGPGVPGGRWTAEPLGCHGVPTALTALSDGRVAAAFWGTLWLRAAGSR